MLGYPISTAKDILADEQLEYRNFWETVPVNGHGEPVRFPGEFVQFSEMKCTILRPAPELGEHNQEILGRELGVTSKRLVELAASRVI
jgi:formyl-CoA transferase